MLLPAERRDGALYHEVGHAVARADGDRLGRLWEAVVWTDGQPRWETPSRYARTSPAEDFAESYRAFIEGRLGDCCAWRAAWLREVVPALAEYEGRGACPPRGG